MSNPTPAQRRCPDVPHNAWYVAAAADEVGRTPLGRRVLGTPVVLYRTRAGTAAALEDRCAHRPVRLSRGTVDGDNIVSGYTGFAYAPDGSCVRVPTQVNVPFGAGVRAFPVREDKTFVWIWVGDPRLAGLRTPPPAPWLHDPGWVSFGDAWETKASIALLHDNFADITHVPFVDPAVAPPALATDEVPPLQVQVSETTVKFSRDYPSAPISDWHAQVLELPEDARHAHREEGEFCSPGLWVDRWTVSVAGHGERDGEHTFVFTHALTPVDERTTRHIWRVSRNFASSTAADGTLVPLLGGYYRRTRAMLEQMQDVIDEDGARTEVDLAADAAVTQVRKIKARLVAEELGVRVPPG
ncbi:MAG TPA: aromatic ring-hydroxylating dioxygenase subunit alpha [Jatrophihabitans sp.]|nr:aromatic ring-hydroxylating dioxygenase subunit alpha [Jatrophihabitans sp.]